MRDLIVGRVAGAPVQVEEREVEGVPVYVITPDGTPDDDRRVFLSIHGGGFTGGAGATCRAMGIGDALQMGVRTRAPDYKMPPDHPYPAPLDDCVAVYRNMLQDARPEEIVVGGASAGGNLAAALLLRARDECAADHRPLRLAWSFAQMFELSLPVARLQYVDRPREIHQPLSVRTFTPVT